MKYSQLSFIFILFTTHILAYSDSVYNKLVETANYAKISYCTINPLFNNGPLAEECPDTSFCTRSKASNAKIVSVIKPAFTKGAISGDSYVAVNDDIKQVFVGFRGTLSLGDVITDISALQCPYIPILSNNINKKDFESNSSDPNTLKDSIINKSTNKVECPDCFVHCGIYSAFAQNIQEVVSAAVPYLDQGYNLTVTGHSLGGAYALLGGIEFMTLGYNPLLITYASVRVGNPSFNQWVDETLFDTDGLVDLIHSGEDLPYPSFSRVFQETDEVPKLPFNIPGSIKYTSSGLKFVIDKVQLPHPKNNVLFQGASNNFADDAANLTQVQPPMSEWVYQHTHQFMKFGCDDSNS
ncbi:putative secreted protein [Wickerhamomyces ciferrii]|uniref:triacylglycerol lipase n=1 Tax=Wickerhamomyces ciferrii (strain ATCC 14091 / BCRC 22168 / CBS 111 / JCM 3599 / NBRC 0793 / NRRL Y-1031 F-60-10) TaxID=1206466 RepID=K0KPW2_WICCF|nr:uncharacterized protein BN7_3761 [Wickerhamomyces ciferrii]CCH44202.1 putative secreted protein [Wickerhamomyces ciferrii]